MSVRKVNSTIRSARKSSGLSQEAMADGVCSAKVLSKIERGLCNPSSSMFYALMKKTGESLDFFSSFTDEDDFDCFYTLQLAYFYLNNYDLHSAYSELEKVSVGNKSINKNRYQEWLLLLCRIKMMCPDCHHDLVVGDLYEAIRLTKPTFNLPLSKKLLFNNLELELLIALLEEKILTNENDFLYLYKFLTDYLSRHVLSSADDDKLLISTQIIYLRFLIMHSSYSEAYSLSTSLKKASLKESNIIHIVKISLFQGISEFHLGNIDAAKKTIQSCIFASHAINYSFFEFCHEILLDSDIALEGFEFPNKERDNNNYSDSATICVIKKPQCMDTEPRRNDFTIIDIIKHERIKQSISMEKLSRGLCSKSTLSKIENNKLTPSITLVECLLQRLGISDRIFTFFANINDFLLNDSLYHIRHPELLMDSELDYLLHNLKTISSPGNRLASQYFIFVNAICKCEEENRIQKLYEALHVTLPDFTFEKIKENRLSWCELSIINNLALETYKNDPQKGMIIFNSLHDYMKATPLDPVFKNSIFPITIAGYVRSLYLKDKIMDLLSLYESGYFSLVKGIPSCFTNSLFFVAQAEATINQKERARLVAQYSVSIAYLIDFDENARILTEIMRNDYSIML